jgi:hypothetical protein
LGWWTKSLELCLGEDASKFTIAPIGKIHSQVASLSEAFQVLPSKCFKMHGMLCHYHSLEKVQMGVLPPVALHSNASQEHLIMNELIVNQKQICLSGHPPQQIATWFSSKVIASGMLGQKTRDGNHHISTGLNITYHTVNCVHYYLLCHEILYRPFVVSSDGKM